MLLKAVLFHKKYLVIPVILFLSFSAFDIVDFEYTSNWENTSWMDSDGKLQKAPKGKIKFYSFGSIRFYPEKGEEFALYPKNYKWLKLNEGSNTQVLVPLRNSPTGNIIEPYQILAWNDKYILAGYMSRNVVMQHIIDKDYKKLESMQGFNQKTIDKKVQPYISGCDIMSSIKKSGGILYASPASSCDGKESMSDLLVRFEKMNY